MRSRSLHLARYAALGILLHLPPCAWADTPQVVEVVGVKRPAFWPYHRFYLGIEEFEANRSMAPQARLHFKLRPNDPAYRFEQPSVSIEGNGTSVVAAAPDGIFDMPRIPGDHDGMVVQVDRHHADFDRHWPVAIVRTPGLAENTVRLGDLRLSCRVNMRIFKAGIGFWESATLTVISGRLDWCAVQPHGGQAADAPFDFVKASMADGQRRQAFAYATPQHRFSLPLDKEGWSDDTLITFEP